MSDSKRLTFFFFEIAFPFIIIFDHCTDCFLYLIFFSHNHYYISIERHRISFPDLRDDLISVVLNDWISFLGILMSLYDFL